MKRIAFVAPPFAGHLNPQLVLAAAARDAGYDVTVITGERKLDLVRAAALTAHGLQSIGPTTLEDIANSPVRIGSNPIRLLGQFRDNLATLIPIRDELVDLWTQCRPDLVVADSVAPVAGFVCETLAIPWITTVATPFAIGNRRGVPAYCGGWTPGGFPGRDALGRAAIRHFKRAVAWYFRREFRPIGGPFPFRPDGSERVYSPRAILGFGIREIEFERDWPACFEMIGPVPACPDNAPAWEFSAPRPRVLVSIGTHLLWAKQSLEEQVLQLAEACPLVHFAISMGGGTGPERRISDRVTVYPFIPYERDLKHFDAVLHHGGAGVTYAAILNCIPSVVVPHDYDQFDYAARIEHFGCGLRAATIAGAGPALMRLLVQADCRDLYRASQAAKAYRPAERFLEIVNGLLSAPTVPATAP